MKFGQLIEYSMRNTFLKNHTQNVMEKLFPDPFMKIQNWAYLWINSLKFYTVCLYYMPSYGLSKYIQTKPQTTCFYLIYSFLKRSGTSLPASISAWFLTKYFLFYLNKFVHCVCKPGFDVINFEINLIFQIELFFPYDQKAKTKI